MKITRRHLLAFLGGGATAAAVTNLPEAQASSAPCLLISHQESNEVDDKGVERFRICSREVALEQIIVDLHDALNRHQPVTPNIFWWNYRWHVLPINDHGECDFSNSERFSVCVPVTHSANCSPTLGYCNLEVFHEELLTHDFKNGVGLEDVRRAINRLARKE